MEGQLDPTLYTSHEGLIFYKGKICISSTSLLREVILRQRHDSPLGGYSEYHKTLKKVRADFFWPGLRAFVCKFVSECDVRLQVKGENVAPTGLLQLLPIPEKIWTEIAMDFIDGLPRSQGYDTIMVILDRLSKYAHFLLLSHPYSASSVARLFLDNIFKLHGMPISIVNDRDPIFTSTFWQELFKLQGTQLKLSSAYHPQTDGQSEVLNRCLGNYLRCFVGARPKDWVKWLSPAEWWYNTNTHSAIGMTPFEVVDGSPPPRLTSYIKGITWVRAMDDHLKSRDQIARILKEKLEEAQQCMKRQADLHRT